MTQAGHLMYAEQWCIMDHGEAEQGVSAGHEGEEP